MTNSIRAALPTLWLALALSACGDGATAGQASASASTSASPADEPGPERAAQRAGKAGAKKSPERGDAPKMKASTSDEIPYPADGIAPISGSCTQPWALLASGSAAAIDGATVPAVEQAVLANPQFIVADADPHAAGQVALELHKKGDELIVGRCHDAGTCTRLAAMVKAVVTSSAPQTGCGELPRGLSASTRLRALAPALPAKADKLALCARLGACEKAAHPSSSEDVTSACQKAPSSFKTDCAIETACDDVESCAKR